MSSSESQDTGGVVDDAQQKTPLPQVTTTDGLRESDKLVYRSFAIISEMLTDRGEDVTSLQHISPRDVVAMSGGHLVFRVDVPSCGVRVIYNLNPRFKLVAVRKFLDVTVTPSPSPDFSLRTVILVSNDKPIHNAIKGLNDMAINVQLFQLKELQFNVSRHVHVPKHEPVRDKTIIREIMKKYSIENRTQFPVILSTDPMAKYLGLKPGQLVRITRFSPSAGTYVFYRCCKQAE